MPKRFNISGYELRISLILVLALIMLLLLLIAGHPFIVERYYSRKLYPFICNVLHPVFNLFPFSVGDVLYIGLTCYSIYTFIKLIRLAIKRKWVPARNLLMGIIIGLQLFLLTFYIFWGLNYFRPSAAKRLNLQDSGYSIADLRAVTVMMIDSANAYRSGITKSDLQQSNKAIYQVAIKAVNNLDDGSTNFNPIYPNVKPSLLTSVINYLGTSGYYNPFTGEAQINYQMPVFIRPFVACHEMSHQIGFGPEDEADFVGYLAGIKSSERLLRYSAYYTGMQEFMHALHMQDSIAQKELKSRLSPMVIADLRAESNYWLNYEGKLDRLSGIFYDNFLKANHQPQRLNTYNLMVRLVMGYYKAGEHLAQFKVNSHKKTRSFHKLFLTIVNLNNHSRSSKH